ncbi:MAG: PAS domain-containing protein, partial [Candidatus Helarchaeota archaeon]
AILGVIIIQGGRVKYLNEVISKYFDHSIEEIMTWSRDKFIEIIHPDDREHVLNILFSHSISKMKERLQHISYRTISGSGDVKWFEAYAKIIHYKGEEAILVTILDVTEKRGRYRKKRSRITIERS